MIQQVQYNKDATQVRPYLNPWMCFMHELKQFVDHSL
jgi:hypothetical protein